MSIPLYRWLLRLASMAIVTTGLLSCAPKQAVKPVTASLAKSQSLIFPSWTKTSGGNGQKTLIRPQPVQVERWGHENYVALDFNDSDINTVFASIGKLTGTVYLPGPGVAGGLTMRSYRRFPQKYLGDVFLNVLEINGFTAVKEGASYRVVPMDGERKALAAGVTTEIIPLEYVKAADVEDKIRELMPAETDAVIYDPANLIIAVSTPHNMVKLMNIITTLDIPEWEKEKTKAFVYYVENGSAKNLADAITKAYYSETYAVKERSRSVNAHGRIHGGYNEGRHSSAVVKGDAAGSAETEETTSVGHSGLTVTPYAGINALIIKSTPGQYLSLLALLKRLDVPPKQVLIDVLEAEVKLGPDETQFGLEWLLRSTGKLGVQGGFTQGNVSVDPSTPSGLNVNPPTPGGFTGSALNMSPLGSINLAAFLTALQSENRLDVLASPHILALDGKEASIAIGDDVPVAAGLIEQPSATISNTLVSRGQIHYKMIGKLLYVTPHVTEDGKVTLKLSMEVSDLGAVVPIAGQNFQAFTAKTADTTAEVENGHTLLIGGLMSETRQTARSGVPLLSDIPILGYLFSFDTKTYEKDELIVLVTPYIVSNSGDADNLTAQFTDRLRIVKGMGNQQ